MISKYFENIVLFIYPNIGLIKKKFEDILKSKISKDFFQKKITSEKRKEYLDEIFDVIAFYADKGFFDEEKLIEFKIEGLKNKGYSLKKMKLFLKKIF